MKYLILGAGPAGLTIANKLRQAKKTDFLLLEKEKEVGGLCRSLNVDGAPFDIGGGHFLDVRHPDVVDFLFTFMPEEEWLKYERDSRIEINGSVINYPIEANIWQMKIEDQVEYLKSIASAGCNCGIEKPKDFINWIYWKLGARIAEDYMIPYNRKMFGQELNNLGTYWMEKLPDVSFEETLLSCLTKRAYGREPGHSQFYYPKKYGYGEVWLRMGEAVRAHIRYDASVQEIDFNEKSVMTADGNKYFADIIITTIPWLDFKKITGMPKELELSISELRFSSIQTEYFNKTLDTSAQWIYCPDLGKPYHRILVRHNFCPNSKGYWTETNKERVIDVKGNQNFKYLNQYAYPLNTVKKVKIMKALLGWSMKKGVMGIGRWGEHQHYNSDVTVKLAMKLADSIIDG